MASQIRILRILALLFVALLTLPSPPNAFASDKFANAQYMEATPTGQKKAAPAIKGTLSFNTEKKSIEFLTEKGATAFSISYDSVKSILYEQAATPRYAAAVLVSPLFLLSNSKKHYLTIQYTDAAGDTKFVIVRLDKNTARQAVSTSETETGKKVEQVEQK